MYKQSPSRNHRSKGIKVKHILQICLLLVVCFWLIYQVKHSHEKRKEFDVKDGQVVGKVQINGEVQRLGRKDLPRFTNIPADAEKHGEDEEDKDAEEEENKHEEDEPEREDSRAGERDEEVDSGRGGGDDEIDENETERIEAEHEHEEELEDEEKEREEHEGASDENHTELEENEDVGKEDHSEGEENEDAGKEDHTEPEENEDVRREDQSESDVTSNDQGHDGDSTNTHEAREENYKADDASSEVAHDIQTIIPQTGNATMGHANEMFGKANFGQENETKSSDTDDALIQSRVQPREEDMSDSGTSTNVTVTEQIKYETDLTKSGDSLLQNSTLPSPSIDHPENSSNSTAATGEVSALLSNGTQTRFGSNLSQNATGEGTNEQEKPNLQSNILENTNKTELPVDNKSKSEATVGSNKAENVNSNAGESLISSNTTLDTPHRANGTDTMAAEEDSLLRQGEKSIDSGTTGSDEVPEDHSSDEGLDVAQHDPIDASDTSLTQEEKESRTDLDTLPEITTEVQTNEDAAAE